MEEAGPNTHPLLRLLDLLRIRWGVPPPLLI